MKRAKLPTKAHCDKFPRSRRSFRQLRASFAPVFSAEGPRLNNPAGHLDPAESPAQACAREALEETTHLFTPTHLVGVYLSRFQRESTGEDITYLRLAFSGTLGDVQPGCTLDAGIVRTVWMSPSEVRASQDRHRSPLVLRCIEDHLAGQRHGLDLVYTDAAVAGLGPLRP